MQQSEIRHQNSAVYISLASWFVHLRKLAACAAGQTALFAPTSLVEVSDPSSCIFSIRHRHSHQLLSTTAKQQKYTRVDLLHFAHSWQLPAPQAVAYGFFSTSFQVFSTDSQSFFTRRARGCTNRFGPTCQCSRLVCRTALLGRQARTELPWLLNNASCVYLQVRRKGWIVRVAYTLWFFEIIGRR